MKKILSIMLSLALVISMMAGCSKKESAKELLSKSVEATQKIKTASSDMEISAEVVMPDKAEGEEAPANPFAKFINMINDGKLNFTITQDNENGKAEGKVGITAQGMTINTEMYINSVSEIVLKIPNFDKFIVLNNTFEEGDAPDYENLKKIQKQLNDEIMALIDDSQLSVNYDREFEGKDGKQKLNDVTITFNNDQFYTFMTKAIDVIYSNEEILKAMKASMKAQADSMGQDLSDEEVNKQVDEIIKNMPEMIDKAKELVTFNKVTLTSGIDEKYIAKDFNMIFDLSANIQEEKIDAIITATGQNYDIDKPYEGKGVELTDENSVPLEKFITMMFGMPTIQ